MLGLLNRKISTSVGLIIVILFAILVSGVIIRQYRELMEIKFEKLELEPFEKSLE